MAINKSTALSTVNLLKHFAASSQNDIRELYISLEKGDLEKAKVFTSRLKECAPAQLLSAMQSSSITSQLLINKLAESQDKKLVANLMIVGAGAAAAALIAAGFHYGIIGKGVKKLDSTNKESSDQIDQFIKDTTAP